MALPDARLGTGEIYHRATSAQALNIDKLIDVRDLTLHPNIPSINTSSKAELELSWNVR